MAKSSASTVATGATLGCAKDYITSAAQLLHDVVRLAGDDNALSREIHDLALKATSQVVGALFALDDWIEEQSP